MEIVIKIPREEYEYCKKYATDCMDILMTAVKNGVPLPKGHGRIGDLDALREQMKETRTFDILFVIDRTRPIIEADTESEE